MDNIKVSVIIPTFKRAQLLDIALQELCLQTLKGFEVIVVDDCIGGDGDTVAVTEKEWPITVKYLKNQRSKGANGARNTGILTSRGKYIAFHDDDDKWYPQKLELQYKCLQERNSTWGGAYCGYEMVMTGGTVVPVQAKQEGDLRPSVLQGKINMCAGSTLMVNRKIVAKAGLFDEKLVRYQDLEYVIRLSRHSHIAAVNELLARIEKNEPPYGPKVASAKFQFLNLVKADIDGLAAEQKKVCYAVHLNEIALAYARAGNRRKGVDYICKAIKYRWWLPTRYLTTIMHLIIGKNESPILNKFLLAKYEVKNICSKMAKTAGSAVKN